MGKLISITLSFMLLTAAAFALSVGDTIPKIEISKWINTEPIEINETSGNHIYVIYFWATWIGSISQILNFVSNEEITYKDDNVTFIGITKERPELVEKFFENRKKLQLAVGLDDNAKTYKSFLKNENALPYFFIVKDNEVLWQGSPFELDRVIKRILAKTFDNDEQIKIEELRDKIRNASQYFDSKKELSEAENILKIDPTDEIAIKIISDNYISQDNKTKALETIDSAIKKSISNKYLLKTFYFMKLDVIRKMKIAEIAPLLKTTTSSYTEAFQNYPKFLSEYSVFLLREFPLETIPLHEIHEMATNMVQAQDKIDKNSEKMGDYLQILARTQYLTGNIKEAINTQKLAIPHLNSAESIDVAKLNLSYYEDALKLFKQ